MRSELKRAIGEALKSYRTIRGVSQESLGPSQPYISNIEAGRGSASVDKIEQMANILGVHPVSVILAGYLASSEDAEREQVISRIRDELKEIGF